jgi:hypothetical protein
MTEMNTVDIGIYALIRTGFFAKEYKIWIVRGDDPP